MSRQHVERERDRRAAEEEADINRTSALGIECGRSCVVLNNGNGDECSRTRNSRNSRNTRAALIA